MRRASCLLLLISLFICTSSWALDAKDGGNKVAPSVVAIVDVQRILQKSSAASSVKKQIEEKSSHFQAQIAKEEQSLRAKEKKLAALRETAVADKYAEAEQKLRERFLFVERHVQTRRKAFDHAYNKAMKEVRASLIFIVEAAAKERGVNLVVVKQQVIWSDQTIDITDIVLEELNKQLPDIVLEISEQDSNPFNE